MEESKEGNILIQISKEGRIIDVHSEPEKKYSIKTLMNALDLAKNYLLNKRV